MSILRHMEKTCPETLALAQDWEDVARSVVRTEKKLTEYVHLFLETPRSDAKRCTGCRILTQTTKLWGYCIFTTVRIVFPRMLTNLICYYRGSTHVCGLACVLPAPANV